MSANTSTRWWTAAACADAPRALFFSARRADQAEARSYCARCPVRAECSEAGRNEESGMWGGIWHG